MWIVCYRLIERVRKVFLLARCIYRKDIPFKGTFLSVVKSIISKRTSFYLVVKTDWLERPRNYLVPAEYIKRSLILNDETLCGALFTKRVLFQRMPYYMQRDYVSLRIASDFDIIAFIHKHHKVIGKRNLNCGEDMGIFFDSDDCVLEQLKTKKIDILEEIIEQHHEYSAINASSVNTLRIHTIRTTQGCKVFLYPKLRVGKKGEIVDIGINYSVSYRVLLNHDGCIISSFKVGKDVIPCQEHEDTGYCFTVGKKLPFVFEAEQMCIDAAAKMPEARYIGWDVAITEHGPIIVEANFVSGAVDTYQILHYLTFGRGNGKEIQKMFDCGMESIIYDCGSTLWAVRFADLSYMYSSSATPDVRQQFMLLLQSALHNHGIEFVRKKDVRVNCEIVCNWEKNLVEFGKGKRTELMLPGIIPSDIFSADLLARNLAKQIYQEFVME